MSRYIDADALINRLDVVDYGMKLPKAVVGLVKALLEDAPSIDIVRCKDCKWAKANGTYQWCGRLDSTARITADDYCSYGEREGE